MMHLHHLFTQISTIGAAMLFVLAGQYMTEGHGLNPFLSLPVATLLLLGPHLITLYESDEKVW